MIEHYCADHQGNTSHYAKKNCRVCQLEAEVAALRKDAGRYRWLRDNNERHADEELPYVARYTYVPALNNYSCGRWCDDFLSNEALDAAIDAAVTP